MKAELKLYLKKTFRDGVILEMHIWQVKKSASYPEGVKYSLICIDPISGNKVLMDNHSPKGHHYHVNVVQFEYQFKGVENLISDFKQYVRTYLGVEIWKN